MLESDLLPSRDFYQYQKWAYETILSQRNDVININSFNYKSRKESKPYDLIVYLYVCAFYYLSQPFEFTVWGWSTSSEMWFKYLRNGWAILNNWDITLQNRIRLPNKLISVTPSLARVKNIGQHGINFNVKDDDWHKGYGAVYIEQDKKIEYDGIQPNLISFDRDGYCRYASLCE